MTLLSAFRRIAQCALGLLTLFVTQVAMAAPQPESGWSMPRDVSEHGHRIDWLIDITNVFITILFVIMVIWMVWAVIAHNKNHQAEYDHGASKKHVVMALSISSIIFLIVDGNLWINASRDLSEVFWNYEHPEKHPDTVRIQVNARQWLWQVRYAGPDGEFNTKDDAITTNDVRVPAGAPVFVQLAAPDVIHNFYLPNLRIKMDAVPGTINQLWFQSKEDGIGEYDIGCAQHCGANHYKMKGLLTIMPKEDFKAWLAETSADSEKVFDADDKEAHWGWAWKKI